MVEARAQCLELEFQQLTGQRYDAADVQESTVPLGPATACLNALRILRSLLSVFGSLPDDVLQHIFLFVAFDDYNNCIEHKLDEMVDLHAICAVSRRWRIAAISHCALWTSPPGLVVSSIWWMGTTDEPYLAFEDGLATIKSHTDRLRRYLDRSGSLPLATQWEFTPTYHRGMPNFHSYAECRDTLIESLDSMALHSDRWDDIRLSVPDESLQDLSSIKGRLPLLSTLSLSIRPPDDGPSTDTCDFFSEAPALRLVRLSTGNVSVRLPWGQIKIAEITDSTFAYRDLMLSQPECLEELIVHSYSRDHLYPASICLALSLRILSFNFLDDSSGLPASFVDHFDRLVLPSLVELSVQCSKIEDQATSFGTMIKGLVQRSACSLTVLKLPLEISRSHPESKAIFDAFSMLPTVETLSIKRIDADGLRRLTWETSSSTLLLPSLKFINVDEQPIDEATHKVTINALMDMIKSRTTPNNPLVPPALQVDISGYDTQSLHSYLVEWETENLFASVVDSPAPSLTVLSPTPAGDSPFDFLEKTAQRMNLYTYGDCDSDDLQMAALQACAESLRDCEDLEVENHNTSILMVRLASCRAKLPLICD